MDEKTFEKTFEVIEKYCPETGYYSQRDLLTLLRSKGVSSTYVAVGTRLGSIGWGKGFWSDKENRVVSAFRPLFGASDTTLYRFVRSQIDPRGDSLVHPTKEYCAKHNLDPAWFTDIKKVCFTEGELAERLAFLNELREKIGD